MNANYVKIWQTVQLIPEGKVASYGQIADLSGLPGRARLVGKSLQFVPKEGVNGKPVPWHRVLRANGQIAFPPNGEVYLTQRALLIDEGVTLQGHKTKMSEFAWRPDLAEILFYLTE